LKRAIANRTLAISLCAVVFAIGGTPAARADGPATDDDSAAIEAPVGQDSQVGVNADAYADTDPSALTDFRPTLDPHGTWADDPSYGTVWIPNGAEVGSDFQPYVSAGHWAYDDDYAWVSDYEWGWAAFHYGRWTWTATMGWVWIPGREYAGAWVVWRIGDGDYAYVGWAAMAPTWGWRNGVAGGLGLAAREPYVFCPSQEIFSPSVAGRLVGTDQAGAIAAHTRPYSGAAPGRAVAHPFVQSMPRGPAPALLGIAPAQVARLTKIDAGLARARQFARPSTALALGAHPPVVHFVRATMVERSATPRPAARPSGSSSGKRK
jgi:hypothetical protein